ncbi:hypothetical protein KQX54_004617 [Cotesia glomerata]|uniref:Secreted protein n=1 Tax=Cotesia glomerata TaxID=32391 RepID=A0AAV7J566_COTGL|nr:hypothetical protein KQX54_004617 [Cotesia glomerata]
MGGWFILKILLHSPLIPSQPLNFSGAAWHHRPIISVDGIHFPSTKRDPVRRIMHIHQWSYLTSTLHSFSGGTRFAADSQIGIEIRCLFSLSTKLLLSMSRILMLPE